jgi:hypothetical protein
LTAEEQKTSKTKLYHPWERLCRSSRADIVESIDYWTSYITKLHEKLKEQAVSWHCFDTIEQRFHQSMRDVSHLADTLKMPHLMIMVEYPERFHHAAPEYALLTHPMPKVAEWLKDPEQLSFKYREESWRGVDELKDAKEFASQVPAIPNVRVTADISQGLPLVALYKTKQVEVRLTAQLYGDLQMLNAIRQRRQLPEYDVVEGQEKTGKMELIIRKTPAPIIADSECQSVSKKIKSSLNEKSASARSSATEEPPVAKRNQPRNHSTSSKRGRKG